MIKKVFLFAMALFVATTSMNADPAEDPIPLTPIITQHHCPVNTAAQRLLASSI